jgi:hypothetical protein
VEQHDLDDHRLHFAAEIGRAVNSFETSFYVLRHTLVALFGEALERSGGRRSDGDTAWNKVGFDSAEHYGILQMTAMIIRNLDAKQTFNVARALLVHQARCVDVGLADAILGLLKKFDTAMEVRNILAHCTWDFPRSMDGLSTKFDTARIHAFRATRKASAGPGNETWELELKDLLEANSFLNAVEIRLFDLARLIQDMGIEPQPDEAFDDLFARTWRDDINAWLTEVTTPRILKMVSVVEGEPLGM